MEDRKESGQTPKTPVKSSQSDGEVDTLTTPKHVCQAQLGHLVDVRPWTRG